MQTPYQKVTCEDVERLVCWCRDHSIPKGGLFEVYDDPGGINRTVVVVNSMTGKEYDRTLQPLGTFYCNFIEPGVISLDENPEQITTSSQLARIKMIKRVITLLLREAGPGAKIDLTSLGS